MAARRALLLALLFTLSLTSVVSRTISVLAAGASSSASKGGKARCADKCGLSTSSRAQQPWTAVKGFASEFAETLRNAQDHLKAGAAARGISIFLLYPLDTLKTRLQMAPTARAALPPLQPQNLFRGVFGSLTGQIPYGMLTFGSYEVYKSKLLAAFPNNNPFPLYVAAAILGDLTGSFWLCPSEVVKQQMQGGMHASLQAAVGSIYASAGLRGFYRGYVGQIMRDVPFRAVQLPAYEVVKKTWVRRFATDSKTNAARELQPLENMAVGIIAGTFSAAITTPLDVIKTRLMTGAGRVTLGGAASMAKQIVAAEGVRGLYRGLVPRVVYVGPSVGVFFVVYEATKAHLKQEAAAKREKLKNRR